MSQIFKEYPDIVSIEDIQKMLRIGRSAVYKLLKDDNLKSTKVGKKYVVPKQSVIDFLFPNSIHNSTQ